MLDPLQEFPDVAALLRQWKPRRPVYCIHPEIYRATAQEFVTAFSGRVLYAVKANDHPEVIRLLNQGGVRHFDCASLNEVALVKEICPEAKCYFMTPVRLRGAAREAQEKYGVRHFMLDHHSGIEPLREEIDFHSSVVFVRMAVHHPAAMQDLSVRFGAPPADVSALLKAIADAGAEPALAFNVGSNVADPDAYRHSIGVAADILANLPFKLRLVDIGGGFPVSYPGFAVPPLSDYFAVIDRAVAALDLHEYGEIMVEPGRALAAKGLSVVAEVLLRKEQCLYLNDGMYGAFWELRFKGHDRFQAQCYRGDEVLEGPLASFSLFGPTCDSTDTFPGKLDLCADIRAGDYLQFHSVGAYSLAGRTNFNGHYSENVVMIRPSSQGSNS